MILKDPLNTRGKRGARVASEFCTLFFLYPLWEANILYKWFLFVGNYLCSIKSKTTLH